MAQNRGLRPSPYSVFLHESCRYPRGSDGGEADRPGVDATGGARHDQAPGGSMPPRPARWARAASLLLPAHPCGPAILRDANGRDTATCEARVIRPLPARPPRRTRENRSPAPKGRVTGPRRAERFPSSPHTHRGCCGTGGRVDDWRGGGRQRGSCCRRLSPMPVPHSSPWLRFQSPIVGRVELTVGMAAADGRCQYARQPPQPGADSALRARVPRGFPVFWQLNDFLDREKMWR